MIIMAFETGVESESGGSSTDQRLKKAKSNDEMDRKFGFDSYTDGTPKNAWLVNMNTTEMLDSDKKLVSAVDYYFLEEDGSRFKVSMPFNPYFYLLVRKGCEREVTAYLSKKYAGIATNVEQMIKEDLDLPNHLIGLKGCYLKLSFPNVNDLLKVRKELMLRIRKNKEREKSRNDYTEMLTNHLTGELIAESSKRATDQLENVLDIREYDVPYHVRVSIDLRIFVGLWYTVSGRGPGRPPEITLNKDIVDRPDPVVLAFDIETTKLPLKFPESETDQIIMISYMIDGQGYLIVNREIVTADVEDFEYTPKPEYEGNFTIFNEEDEKATLERFFEHVKEVKPNIIVTYNGDFFDWPFVETRAAKHGFNMTQQIGFEKDSQNEYKARQCIHMDAFRWVKRDSYLPMGSQNLKAAAKAKLRYDPVEVDPEDMCRMAREEPQLLANYSVSDAVATYYLYMKYVHPFIFALCTIIPMQPDEVLRKGSGTLCEALLMVEAFHVNIVFPNKQESALRKMTEDGHLLDTETYVGGHVEALESGVFRADIPCRFRLVPAAFQQLMDNVENTMKHALENEEKVTIDLVDNFEEVCEEIRERLENLRDTPARLENPIIYHLDVGAMYPNIILTNRLQPPAIVNEVTCASCHFNRPGAKCQRTMEWKWRGEMTPANRSEYQRIVQQLENEKFPSAFPGGAQRAFHQLSKDEQVQIEKKRLQDYCRKAYKRQKDTRIESRKTVICQRENSFYVDTVRAFRDRRYEYKGMLKGAKKNLSEALASGDAAEIKSCKAKEVLYDSLQLAHKCILNSFYGYVMRKGSRWYSMEMAGIVCYTGANIITQARELIEQIGRPLELDTDGIWCMLPASFPENVTFRTRHPKKPKVTVSYPGAMLNVQVQESFTNHQYHQLIDPATHKYEVKSENSIFFEVDGPYLAMVLPASKEEGKKLKKRYAVFNFDKSLAELKGFEIKRRGELQLIKIFQSSVFDAFLKGKKISETYEAVATVADFWLDVLYSKAADLPDSELFDLVSENRSMSRKLEDYGSQKSTSISTAKRLAEFLGDQMVKDAGLACRFIIAKKPEGAPVTERAIPLAIFQAEPSIKRHYLKRWLRSPGVNNFEIREILDWQYYIERLGSAIQKIITIPAAMQGLSNPVPRVHHPDWLHKRLVEKNDVLRQRRITDIFKPVEKPKSVDMEDIVTDSGKQTPASSTPVTNRKRTLSGQIKRPPPPVEKPTYRNWRDVLAKEGSAPSMGRTKESLMIWLKYQKRKWKLQHNCRVEKRNAKRQRGMESIGRSDWRRSVGMNTFVHASANALLHMPWQIIQIVELREAGKFKLWVLVGQELHQIKMKVPRIFYVNQKVAKEQENGETYRKVNRQLPRSNVVYHLYEYRVPEENFQKHVNEIQSELSTPNVEGIYETQVPLMYRVLLQLGCLAQVSSEAQKFLNGRATDTFELDQLEFRSLAQCDYLPDDCLRHLYLYHYSQDTRTTWALLFPSLRKAYVWIVNKSKVDNMPNLNKMFNQERIAKLEKEPDAKLPKENHTFEFESVTNPKDVPRAMQRVLRAYRDEKHGPTFIAVQSNLENDRLRALIPQLDEFPLVKLHISDSANLYNVLDWQRVACRRIIQHYLNSNLYLHSYAELCRYLHIPLGNVPKDVTHFGADLFFGRHLIRQNHVLWCSTGDRPDLGGKELDDNRLVTEASDWRSADDLGQSGGSQLVNQSGFYPCVCVELDLASVPVTALLQWHRITEQEGGASSLGFESGPQQLSIDQMVSGGAQAGYKMLTSFDETAQCAATFKILRHMLHDWVRDIAQYQNVFADEQIVHFFRWLRSPQALLYDPALKKTLHGLMKKLCLLLISELRRLGAQVIHATFSRLVIATDKQNLDHAKTYVNFVLESLNRKDLFAGLDISPKSYWSLLSWLDPANHGGIPAEPIGENSDENDVPEVQMHWNMMYYLPQSINCQLNFKMILAGYFLVVYNKLQELSQTKDQDDNISATDTFDRVQEAGVGCKLAEFCAQIIKGELKQKLLAIIQKTQRKVTVELDQSQSAAESELFPRLPGSHLNLRSPALELAKSICKVLSFDTKLNDEVGKLRRDLLKLMGLSEFSDDAKWRDPCLSYVLPEVICQHCNHCRDLDLCRDPSLLDEQSQISTWRCSQCGRPYDLAEIEQTLLLSLNRLSMAYCLQDLRCTRCKQIKQSHMRLYCECSAPYANLITQEEFAVKLKCFDNLARFYSMKSLREAIDWFFTLNPFLTVDL